ncbi:unnamed protein product [Prorocentrum cordatum]|uniref:Disease resistance R13L4/SHOC-2-like LRR domain-containing protein n=1 Tax=Prorocentrum cordatum TaxID=2364126 RepID=A0ABN9P8M7_9DINO|nr:unnamed protein product [Polarella glacialis]
MTSPAAPPQSVRARLSGGLSWELPGDLKAGEVRARVAEELGVAEEHLELIDSSGKRLDDAASFAAAAGEDPDGADAAAGGAPGSVDLLAVILDAAEQSLLQVTGVDDLAELKGRSRLDLNGRQLRELPQTFSELRGLLELDASHNQLSALPDNMGSLSLLRVLNLRSNRIQHLPHTFTQLASLRELDLAHNSIYLLPAEMGDLVELRTVDLSHNGLVGLPRSFGSLHNLQRCDVSSNEMELLPQIDNLNSLETLDLSNNKLWGLPDDFGAEMQCLSSLDLSHNSLSWLPWAFFDHLSEVGRLDLSHNKLSALPLSARRVAWADGVNLQERPWPPWSLLLASRALALAGGGCRCRPGAWWLPAAGTARQPTFAAEGVRDGMREALNGEVQEATEAQPASDEAE